MTEGRFTKLLTSCLGSAGSKAHTSGAAPAYAARAVGCSLGYLRVSRAVVWRAVCARQCEGRVVDAQGGGWTRDGHDRVGLASWYRCAGVLQSLWWYRLLVT